MKLQAETYLMVCGLYSLPKKNDLSGWQTQPVTEKQKEYLNNVGLGYSRIKYKGQASIVIDAYTVRRNAKMATPKQLAVLLSNGVPITDVTTLTIKQASDKIRSLFQVAH